MFLSKNMFLLLYSDSAWTSACKKHLLRIRQTSLEERYRVSDVPSLTSRVHFNHSLCLLVCTISNSTTNLQMCCSTTHIIFTGAKFKEFNLKRESSFIHTKVCCEIQTCACVLLFCSMRALWFVNHYVSMMSL